MCAINVLVIQMRKPRLWRIGPIYSPFTVSWQRLSFQLDSEDAKS